MTTTAKTGTGQSLWQKAKRIIPGGNQLLSKRAERFLPDLWPAYYSKAKGCEVWDLDGNRYYDFAQMGVGSCSLGYGDPDVNAAVFEAVENGAMSTLNAPEEVELAERLVRLHPWAEMARFARTGGEACAMAVRIARASTGRSKVAFCGYHGWQDWYIAANLGETRYLDGQLLPGLDPAGVPRELAHTALPFAYNKLDELENIAREHGSELAAVVMEPVRGVMPAPGFLEGVRKIADKTGAVLVFDEVTSGFRMALGGIHLNFGVSPDVAVFGKALGNGHPIAAVIGTRKVMDAAQKSFISSLYWTERVGYAAALATLAKMEKVRSWDKLTHYGNRVGEGWKRVAAKAGLDVKVSGIPPLVRVDFVAPGTMPLEAQTLYTQEMLSKGYLVGAAVYTTVAYTDAIVDKFIGDSESVFALIKKAVAEGDVRKYLKGETAHAGFKRLT